MPSLEDLTLGLLDKDRLHRRVLLRPCIPLRSMRISNPLAYLQQVSFGSLKIEQLQIVGFFLAISRTLRHVLIDAIVIEQGN